MFCVRSRLPYGSIVASCAGSRLSFFLCQEKKRLAVCSVSVPRSFARRVLRPAVRFCWNVLRSALRHCCSVLRSSTPVFFPLSGKKKRLAVCFVSIPRGSESPFASSHDFGGLSGFVGSLRDCAFLYGDSDGGTGDAENGRTQSYGVGGAAECVFAQSHWLCHAFRGEYVGTARPKPAPKSLRLSGLSSRCGGVCWLRYASPSPGYTERPDRVQFMLGQVGLVLRTYLHA